MFFLLKVLLFILPIFSSSPWQYLDKNLWLKIFFSQKKRKFFEYFLNLFIPGSCSRRHFFEHVINWSFLHCYRWSSVLWVSRFCSFIRPFISLFSFHLLHSLIKSSLIKRPSQVKSLLKGTHYPIHQSILQFPYSFIYSFIHSFIRLINQSINHLFIHSPI